MSDLVWHHESIDFSTAVGCDLTYFITTDPTTREVHLECSASGDEDDSKYLGTYRTVSDAECAANKHHEARTDMREKMSAILGDALSQAAIREAGE
jgi:hypothetical protein